MAEGGMTAEIIVLMADDGTKKEMALADFEVLLDGMVGVAEFSHQTIKGAYCWANDKHRILAMVLFTIDFDDVGLADQSWNMPLYTLAEEGLPGPNMGAGNITLTCASQTPREQWQAQLWEPRVSADVNDFIVIRDAVRRCSERLAENSNLREDPFAAYLPGYEDEAEEQHEKKIAELSKQKQELMEKLEQMQQIVSETEEEYKGVISHLRERLNFLQEQQSVQQQVDKHKKVQFDAGVKDVLSKIEKSDLEIIANHHGTGSFNVPVEELFLYLDNPLAYAADQCGTSESNYRAWLKHYRDPICQKVISGSICGKAVKRVAIPTDFTEGLSDRNKNVCSHCIDDSALETILQYR